MTNENSVFRYLTHEFSRNRIDLIALWAVADRPCGAVNGLRSFQDLTAATVSVAKREQWK
jgi:hypothetical protein